MASSDIYANSNQAMKVALERKSAVLKSNAVHHRVDSLTGIAALVSIALSNYYPSLEGMDSVGGLLISWMVVRAGWSNTMTSIQELADKAVGDDIKNKGRIEAEKAIEDCGLVGAQVMDIGGTKAGQNYLLDVVIAVSTEATVRETTATERIIRGRIASKVRGARRIRIRFVDHDGFNPMDEFVAPGGGHPSSEPDFDDHDHEHREDQLHKQQTSKRG